MVLRRDHAQGYGNAMHILLKHPTTLLNECVLRRGETGRVMSAWSKADITARSIDVRFTPESGHWLSAAGCPLCAKSGQSATQQNSYLIRRPCDQNGSVNLR